ncbi:hypothetical protein EC973_007953 [Apophysomyces ossiformis]|uniref:RNase III domain-containing protein n=1 Tax=Apophysomyces ossiformis TaxID=679940 RepID=A0A8H7EQN1_9FUNG|nr:hypothetical protein EC973_007953 [Apophysomyces ossiformis]
MNQSADINQIATLRSYVMAMFTHVAGTDGRALDMSRIVDEYVQLFLPDDYDVQVSKRKHIAFLGENTLHYTLAAYLIIRFPDVSEDIMVNMKNAITNDEIARLIGAQLRVTEHLFGQGSLREAHLLLDDRLTCVHFGSQVVNSFLSPILDETCATPLRKLPRKIQAELGLRAKNNQGPVYQFNQMLSHAKGDQTVQYANVSPDSRLQVAWSARVIYQLASGAPYFEHTRIAVSKKAAREIAIRDILQYYENNPGDYHMHQVVPEQQISNQPTVLRIEVSDTLNDQQQTQQRTSMVEDVDLENLLLGRFSEMKTE